MLRRPAILALVLSLSVRRIAAAGFPIVFVVALASEHGFGTAAALQGLMTFALLVSAPYRARILDRFGRHRALVPQSVAYMTSLLSLAILSQHRSVPVVLLGAAVVATALLNPAMDTAIRASWRHAANDDNELKAMHTADSLVEEMGFFVGPVTASVLMLTLGPRVGLVAMAVLICAGILLVLCTPAIRLLVLHPPAPQTTDTGTTAVDDRPISRHLRSRLTRVAHTVMGPIARPDLREVVAPLIVMGFSFGLLAIAIPAVAQAHGSIASTGFITAAISAGGVIGGLAYGALHLRNSLWQRQALLSIGFGVPVILVALTHTPLPLAGVLALAGLSVTPLYINSYLLIDKGIPPQVKHEANSWVAVGNDIGYVAGISLGGLLLQHGGYSHALYVAGAVGVVLVAIAARGLARESRDYAPTAEKELV